MNTNNAIKGALLSLSLEKNEVAAYLYLTKHGASNLSSIAKGVHVTRVTAYVLIHALLKRGFVIKTTLSRRTLYEACDPNKLLASLETVYKEGTLALTQLSAAMKTTLFIPNITIHSGKDGLSTIFDDVVETLPRGGTYFRYTSRKDDISFSNQNYRTLRKEKEIERLVITSVHKAEQKSKDANRFIKTVPKDFNFDDNVMVLIYGNKMAHIDVGSQTGIVIESPQLAHFQEKIFKLLWRKL